MCVRACVRACVFMCVNACANTCLRVRLCVFVGVGIVDTARGYARVFVSEQCLYVCVRASVRAH